MKPVTLRLLVVLAVLASVMGCGASPDRFQLPATAAVAGQVVDTAGARVGQARVTLESASFPSVGRLGPFFANAGGTYSIQEITPGRYDVVADQGTGDSERRGRIRFVTLVPGESRLLPDLTLRPPATLSGRAILEGAVSSAGIKVQVVGTNRSASTNASGDFTIGSLETGRYSVLFTKEGFVPATVDSVDLVSGVTTPVSATLLPVDPSRVADITGRILLEAESDHSGILVSIVGTARSLVTTPGGFFRFPGLPLSTYSIEFEKQGFFSRTRGGIQLRPGASRVDLGTLQLDRHRVLGLGIKAFGLSYSPSGTQIAFLTPEGEVAVMDSAGMVFSQVLTTGASAALDRVTGLGRGISWSPDGKEILYTRLIGSATNAFDIAVVPSAGGAPRSLLTSGTDYFSPEWSPEGDAFTYYLTPNLHRVPVARGTGRTEATTANDRVITTPAIGSITAFTGHSAGRTGRIVYGTTNGAVPAGLFTVPALGGVGPVEIIPTRADGQQIRNGESPDLTPAADRIVFSFNDRQGGRAEQVGLWVMAVDGTGATRFTTTPANHIEVSPDGRKVVFTDARAGANLGTVLEAWIPPAAANAR